MRSAIVISDDDAPDFRKLLFKNGVQFTEAGNANSPTHVFKSEQSLRLLHRTFIKNKQMEKLGKKRS